MPAWLDDRFNPQCDLRRTTGKLRQIIKTACDGQLELSRLDQSAPNCVPNETGGFVDVELVHKPRPV
jgi:hypothetical protein